MIFGLLIILFLFVCILLCFLVLIQSDKGGGISGALGGGLANASNVFGAQDTANVLTRATTWFAVAYIVLCVGISLFVSRPNENVDTSLLKARAEKSDNFAPASILQDEALPMAQEGGTAADEGESADAASQVPPGVLPLKEDEDAAGGEDQ